VCIIILDIDASGKKSKDAATRCVCSLEKIGIESIDGPTNDSGAGTLEFLVAELVKANKMVQGVALSDSSALHDLQSISHLPMRHCTGDGGLDNRNVMQLIHAVWDMFAKFKECFALDTWRRALSRTWKETEGDKSRMRAHLTDVRVPIRRMPVHCDHCRSAIIADR
jgi:hypothetical protein